MSDMDKMIQDQSLELMKARVQIAELVQTLLMAQAELLTLHARLTNPYAKNVGLALDRIKEVLAKVEAPQ